MEHHLPGGRVGGSTAVVSAVVCVVISAVVSAGGNVSYHVATSGPSPKRNYRELSKPT